MEGKGEVSKPIASRFSRAHVWGGISLLLMSVLFFVLTVLSIALTDSTSALSPLQPITGSGLQSLAQHAQLARVTFGVGIVSDLVLLPGILGLYESLKRLNRDAMLVAAVFLGMYALMDLLVTGMNVVALVSVAQSYATSPSGPSAPSFGVAVYIHSVISVSLPLSSAMMSVGILLVGWTVRYGPFGSFVRYLSYFTAAVGLLYGLSAIVPGLTGFIILSALSELVWFAVMGWKLIRSGPLLLGPEHALATVGDEV